MKKHIGLLGLLALGFVACDDDTVESEDIRTSGIYAEFEVVATGNGKATVEAELRVGGDGGTHVVLTGDDKLVCSADDTQKTLSKNGDVYKATFTGDAGGTEFTFALKRSSDNEDAPDSVVTLPDPFTIVGPETDEVSRTNGELTVTWEVSTTKNDPMTWTIEGDCLFDTDGNVPNDGTLTLSGDAFDSTATKQSDEKTCDAKLCLERKRKGVLDPAFADEEGGKIYAYQRRCIDFVSAP
jgi:hypothetical protein